MDRGSQLFRFPENLNTWLPHAPGYPKTLGPGGCLNLGAKRSCRGVSYSGDARYLCLEIQTTKPDSCTLIYLAARADEVSIIVIF